MAEHPTVIYLSAWREHFRLTQDQLAERIGVNKGTISRWENGERRMNTDQILNVAKALGIEPLAIFRAPDNQKAALAIERFAKLVDRVGAERAEKLLDLLNEAI